MTQSARTLRGFEPVLQIPPQMEVLILSTTELHHFLGKENYEGLKAFSRERTVSALLTSLTPHLEIKIPEPKPAAEGEEVDVNDW